MAVVKTFTMISLLFVLADTATGVVSFLAGRPSIPPSVGFGTALNLTILVAGLAVLGLRAFRPGRNPVKRALVR